MSAGGPYELRGYTDEDYEILDTVEGSGTLTGTFTLSLWAPDGTAITGGVSCSITDAAAREVTGVIAGLSLDPGTYRWSIRKTTAGQRVVSACGVLVLLDDTGV